MAKKRRKLRKEVLLVIILIVVLLLLVILLFFSNFNFKFINKTSVHNDALTYKTKDCLVFYPNSETGKQKAIDISKNATEEDMIFDYALIPYGDYYLVSYSDGTSYYIDKNNNDLKIDSINEEGKKIVSDYLRYSMKKDEIDEAYSYDFLKDTYYKNIDLSSVEYKVDGTNLLVYFDKYDYSVSVPLKYMQEPCGINLGYENELYVKQRYVSNNRKMICFTFDDGPDMSLETSGQIVEQLYKYDSSGTFFILGYRLGEKQINFCKESVEKGIEYGSHTQNHPNLTKLSSGDIYTEVMIPYHDLCDNEYGFDYQMKVFRPPYGSRNSTVDESVDLTAVLWNVDSLDWSYRTQYEHDACVDVIFNKVVSETNENDVVLFHDIYKTSVDAASELVEYFIKEGYQLVSASEMMEALGITNVNVFSGQ